jgi:diguanylate cyclase (GGDEF)-like protein
VNTADKTRILVVDPIGSFGGNITPLLEDHGYFAYSIDTFQTALGSIYNEPPDVILLYAFEGPWKDFLKELKGDSLYSHLPVIAILQKAEDLGSSSPDDFVLGEKNFEEILLRIQLTSTRAAGTLDANPLTRLPGNYAISHTIQSKIDQHESFALAYVDIDNFKSFNDKYGFSRGDDALRMTARVIVNVIRRCLGDGAFVGHVGGDDFVFIVPEDSVENVCTQILMHFEMIAPSLYDDDDRARGKIQSVDRAGNPAEFALMTLSIAVVFPVRRKMQHPGEAAGVAGQIKTQVKKLDGNNFMLDTCTDPIALS